MGRFDVEHFYNTPDPDLVCPICHCVLEKPTECPCHHIFCLDCIEKWLVEKRSCPSCRKRTKKHHIHPATPVVKNIIGRLLLKCVNQEQGCLLKVQLEQYDQHVKSCEYQLVTCKHSRCGRKFTKKELQAHETACKKREEKCSKCHLCILAQERNKHNCVKALLEANKEQKNVINDLERERHELLDHQQALNAQLKETEKALQEERDKRAETRDWYEDQRPSWNQPPVDDQTDPEEELDYDLPEDWDDHPDMESSPRDYDDDLDDRNSSYYNDDEDYAQAYINGDMDDENYTYVHPATSNYTRSRDSERSPTPTAEYHSDGSRSSFTDQSGSDRDNQSVTSDDSHRSVSSESDHDSRGVSDSNLDDNFSERDNDSYDSHDDIDEHNPDPEERHHESDAGEEPTTTTEPDTSTGVRASRRGKRRHSPEPDRRSSRRRREHSSEPENMASESRHRHRGEDHSEDVDVEGMLPDSAKSHLCRSTSVTVANLIEECAQQSDSSDSWQPPESEPSDTTTSEGLESESSYDVEVPPSAAELLDHYAKEDESDDDTWSPGHQRRSGYNYD